MKQKKDITIGEFERIVNELKSFWVLNKTFRYPVPLVPSEQYVAVTEFSPGADCERSYYLLECTMTWPEKELSWRFAGTVDVQGTPVESMILSYRCPWRNPAGHHYGIFRGETCPVCGLIIGVTD